MRKKSKFCAVSRSLSPGAHNLKVIGSNPIPATKLRRQVKDLAAFSFLRLCCDPAPGSTVEARGSVIVGKSTGWCVGRDGILQRQVGKARNCIKRAMAWRGPVVAFNASAPRVGHDRF